MTPETHWLPGLLVLGGALLIGVVYLLLTRHRNQRLADREEQQTELDRKAQLYLDQLRELNQEQHHLSPEQYQAEKSRLELLAAAALRSRDEHRQRPVAAGSDSTPPTSSAPSQTTPRPAGFFDRNPQLKGALWGAGVVLFFVMIGVWLSQAEKPRQGGEATGKDPSAMGANVAPMVDDEREQGFQRALTRANEHPDDVNLSASVVHELIRREDWPKAIALTDRSLGVDPFHPEHRIHRALFRASRGEIDEAIADLQQLAMIYPNAHEALLFVGTISLERGDERRALEYLERFEREAPEDEKPSQLPHAIAELRTKLGMGGPRK